MIFSKKLLALLALVPALAFANEGGFPWKRPRTARTTWPPCKTAPSCS